MRFAAIVLLSSSLVACGGEVASAVSHAAAEPPPSSPAAPTPSPDTPPSPTPVEGTVQVFHTESVALDEINVAIEPDHTFRFLFNECDARATACGVWQSGKDGYTLEPAAGQSSFAWFDGTQLVRATSLTLVPTHDGSGSAKVTGLTTNGSFSSTWTEGRTCAVCDGDGPTAVKACSEPLSVVCT